MTAVTDDDKKIMIKVLTEMRDDMARPDYTPPKYQGQFSHLNDDQFEEGIKATTKVFIENLRKGVSDKEMEEILYKAGLDYLATL